MVGFHAFFPHSVLGSVCLDSMQVLCKVMSQSLCLHMHICLLYLESTVPLALPVTSGSYSHPTSSSAILLGRGDMDAPFRTERCTVSHSLHIMGSLWANCRLPEGKASLMRIEMFWLVNFKEPCTNPLVPPWAEIDLSDVQFIVPYNRCGSIPFSRTQEKRHLHSLLLPSLTLPGCDLSLSSLPGYTDTLRRWSDFHPLLVPTTHWGQ